MKKGLILLTGLTLLSLSSCKKVGCSDIDAENYDADVKPKNSVGCQYKGSVIFWSRKELAQYLVNDGAQTLYYYVDNELVGTGGAGDYWNSQPDCGTNGSVTINKDLGAVKNKSYAYSIVDQTGYEYASGVVNFTANTCQAIELK